MNFKSLFKLVKNSTFGKVENSTRDLEKRPLTNLGNDDSEEISNENLVYFKPVMFKIYSL